MIAWLIAFFRGCSLESRLSLCITRILSLRQKSQTTRDFDRVIKERVITNQERVIITFHHALTNVLNLLEPTWTVDFSPEFQAENKNLC